MPTVEMISGPCECNPCYSGDQPPPPSGDPGDGNGNIQFFCDYYMVSRIGSPNLSFRYPNVMPWTNDPEGEHDLTITVLGAQRSGPVWSKTPTFPQGFDPEAPLPLADPNTMVHLGAASRVTRMLQLVSDWSDDTCSPVRNYLAFDCHIVQARRDVRFAQTTVVSERSYVKSEGVVLNVAQQSLVVGGHYYKPTLGGGLLLSVPPTAHDGTYKVFPTHAGRFYYCNGGGAFNGVQTNGNPTYDNVGNLLNPVIDQSSGNPFLGPAIGDGDVFMARMNYVYSHLDEATLIEVPRLDYARNALELCLATRGGGMPAPPLPDLYTWCPYSIANPGTYPYSSRPANLGSFDLSTIVGRWFNIYTGLGGATVENGQTLYSVYTQANDLGAMLVGIIGNAPAIFSFAGNRLLNPGEGQPILGRQVSERHINVKSPPKYKVIVVMPHHVVGAIPSTATVSGVVELTDKETLDPELDGLAIFVREGEWLQRKGTVGAPICGGCDVSGDVKAGFEGALDWTGGTGTDESDIDPTTESVDFEPAPAPTISEMQALYVPTPVVSGIASAKLASMELVLFCQDRDITFEVRGHVPNTPWESLPVIGSFPNGTLFNSVTFGAVVPVGGYTHYMVRGKTPAGVLGVAVQVGAGQTPTAEVRPRLTYVADGTKTLPQITPTWRAGVALDRNTEYGGFTLELRNAANQLLHKFETEDIDYGMGTGDDVATWRRYHTPSPYYLQFIEPNYIKDRRRVDGLPGGGTAPYARVVQTDYNAANADYRIRAGTFHVIW